MTIFRFPITSIQPMNLVWPTAPLKLKTVLCLVFHTESSSSDIKTDAEGRNYITFNQSKSF